MPADDERALVAYAKMLEDRCDEMARVIRELCAQDQITVRKLTTFETAEYIFSDQH